MSFTKRLTAHYKDLLRNPSPFCHAEPENPEDNLAYWTGYIDGPENTPYAGGRFRLYINFPSDYPFKPPEIRFTTPIYHPNIGKDGEICLDLLHSQWSPVLGVRHLLISLCSLLSDPNPDHGLNKDALASYRADPTEYENIVRQWTEKYALKSNQ